MPINISDLVKDGGAAMRMLPLMLGGTTFPDNIAPANDFDGFGSARDLIAIAEPETTIASTASETQFYEFRMGNGKIIKVPKAEIYLDYATGLQVAKSGEGDQFKLNCAYSYADKKYFIDLIKKNAPVAIANVSAVNANGTIEGWDHMIARITGGLVFSQSEGIGVVTLTLKAGEGFTVSGGTPPDYAAYNSAMITTPGELAPFGTEVGSGDAIAQLASAADFTTLLSGSVVVKDVP